MLLRLIKTPSIINHEKQIQLKFYFEQKRGEKNDKKQ